MYEVTLFFVDVTDFLITLSLLWSIAGSLRGLEALLEIVKRLWEIVLLLLLKSDCLIDAHELLADGFLQCGVVSGLRLPEGRYQILHRRDYAHHFLLADAETHIGLRLAPAVLVLDANVQALLIEI